MHFVEFPSRVGDTTGFDHLTAAKDVVIPSIAVDLQYAGKAMQKLQRPLLAAIELEVKHHGLPRTPGTAAIRPQIAGSGVTRARRQHRYGSLIGLEIALGKQLSTQHLDQWLQ